MEKVPKYLKKLFWFYKISEFGLNRFEIVFQKLCWILLLEKEKVFKKRKPPRPNQPEASPTAAHPPPRQQPTHPLPFFSFTLTDRWGPRTRHPWHHRLLPLIARVYGKSWPAIPVFISGH